MQVKKQKLEPDMEQWTGSKLGKEYIKAVYRHPAYLTYMQSACVPAKLFQSCPTLCNLSIMRNARLDESQAVMKIARRNINNLRYADDTGLMTESGEELKSLLMKVKEESEKAGLKQHSQSEDHAIWSHHFMANRWGNRGNSGWLYFLGLQNLCGWWLKPWN